MARHRGFLEVRGISRESSATLTHDAGGWGGITPVGGYPLSALSSHHSLLSFSNPEYESTEGLHSSGISSADSWAQDDEFDRNATRRVRLMFEELESTLYEGYSASSSKRSVVQSNRPLRDQPKVDGSNGDVPQMERECREWTEMFPHFRLLGKQVFIPLDDGTQFISTNQEMGANLLDRTLSIDDEHYRNLVLEGQQIKQSINTDNYCEEEVFAAEGENEEYIAYDKPEMLYNSSVVQVYYKYHQKSGYPPITPKSHRKHTIQSIVFERLWIQSMNISEPLISKAVCHRLPDILDSRSSERPALISSTLQQVEPRGLQDVMTIRRVPLQERSSSQQAYVVCSPHGSPPHLNQSKHWSHRDMPSTRPQSSRLQVIKSVTGLLPLRQKSRENLPPVDRIKILSPIFNSNPATDTITTTGLRGKQLRQQPRRLPPLVAEYVTDSDLYNTRIGESRAASAQPEESRRHMRTYFSPDGRPNTTSSFRVQTALTRRPPSTSLSRKYHPRVGVGLEIFGASTGTTVSSKGSRLAVVDGSGYGDNGGSSKSPAITENVFTKPGPVWITGVQGAALRKANVR